MARPSDLSRGPVPYFCCLSLPVLRSSFDVCKALAVCIDPRVCLFLSSSLPTSFSEGVSICPSDGVPLACLAVLSCREGFSAPCSACLFLLLYGWRERGGGVLVSTDLFVEGDCVKKPRSCTSRERKKERERKEGRKEGRNEGRRKGTNKKSKALCAVREDGRASVSCSAWIPLLHARVGSCLTVGLEKQRK